MAEHIPYKVVVGHGVIEEDLITMIQQPFAPPVAPVERHYGISGAHYDEGLFVYFHFDFVDSGIYASLLNQFGLQANETANVTVYARDDLLVWSIYEGIAHRPEPGVDAKWESFFLRDIRIYVTDMVKVA